MVKTSKTHPESLKETNSLEVTPEIREFCNDLYSEIEEADAYRTSWANHIDSLDRLRYGIRKPKNRPWVGAANYSIPLIDSNIQRMKPSYVNMAYGVSPVCTFVPYGPEDVDPMRKREQLFDWRLRTQVDFFEPYNEGIDLLLGSRGMSVFKVIWKFSTRNYYEQLDITDLPPQVQDVIYDPRMTDEVLAKIIAEELRIDLGYEENVDEIDKAIENFRNGETVLKMDLVETNDDQPEIIAKDIKDELVVPWETRKLQDARFIDDKFWMSKNDLKICMLDEKYVEYGDDDIDSWEGTENGSLNVNRLNYKNNDDMVLLHEVCCWYDVNGDGIKEKCIATYPDADPSSVLRFIELPYDHGLFPYVQVKREINGPGFYDTRGIPSLDEDFQVGISTLLNQAIDNGTLLNTPERVARKNILSNQKNRRYVPGELVEVSGDINQYQTRIIGNAAQGYQLQMGQYLKSWSDTRQGNLNIGGQNDLPGIGEKGKKTATEVSTLSAMEGQNTSYELQVFQNQMANVYYQIDALYQQFGNDEEEILITGNKPEKVSRYEIQGKFDIVPNGRLDNSTPLARMQKSMFVWNLSAQVPFAKHKNIYEEIIKDVDPRFVDRFVKTDEEIGKEQQAQQQAMLAQEQKMKQEAIGMKKISDDLDIRKEIILEPIQGKKYAAD